MSLVPAPNYKIATQVADFARNGVLKFDGMLNKSGAYMAAAAAAILHDDLGWHDKAFLEIGVYKGKFFSLIERATRGSNCRLVGIDPFVMDGQSKGEVIELFQTNGVEMNRVCLEEGFSSDIGSVSKALADRPLILCHVDGSHAEEDVYADFYNVDRLLATEGIVIGDDFWHKSHLQVTTAIFRIVLEDKIDLKPFMIAGAKIYMCRSNYAASYREKFIEAFRQNDDLAMFSDWLQARAEKKWYHTEQKMSRWPVIII